MCTLDYFLETLDELMIEKDLNIERLAKESKCHRSIIDTWKDRRYYPNVNSLIKLADYFHCSIDYLFGLSEKRDFEPNYVSNFLKRYKELKEKNKLEDSDVAVKSETNSSTISKWKKYKNTPGTITLIKLTETFGCSFEYLIGRC